MEFLPTRRTSLLTTARMCEVPCCEEEDVVNNGEVLCCADDNGERDGESQTHLLIYISPCRELSKSPTPWHQNLWQRRRLIQSNAISESPKLYSAEAGRPNCHCATTNSSRRSAKSPKGILLYGLPNTSKTPLMWAIASGDHVRPLHK
jgi:hypothetical protein